MNGCLPVFQPLSNLVSLANKSLKAHLEPTDRSSRALTTALVIDVKSLTIEENINGICNVTPNLGSQLKLFNIEMNQW